MPSLKPDTQLLTRVDGLDLNGENAFSAMLNWMYTPRGNASQNLQYFLFQNGDHIQEALDRMDSKKWDPQPHMIGTFGGKYQVAMEFGPTFCLRVLDPDLDPY